MTRLVTLLLVVVTAAVTVLAQGPARSPDVIFVPTPQEVVDGMLKMAQITPTDVLYDLGSGDGRIPITAAVRYGIRAVGVEIDPIRVREANENARVAGVADKVRFLNQDLFTTDIREATVVTLYLLPSLNLRLRPKLNQEVRRGARVISHAFNMGPFMPLASETIVGRTIYFWRTPIE
jgi:hypothetical protein